MKSKINTLMMMARKAGYTRLNGSKSLREKPSTVNTVASPVMIARDSVKLSFILLVIQFFIFRCSFRFVVNAAP